MLPVDQIPWQNIQLLWSNTELRLQWVSLLVIVSLTAVLKSLISRLIKKNFLQQSEATTSEKWVNHSLRLLAPTTFLLLSVLCLSVFQSLHLDTSDFIRPAFNASVAWMAYRMIGTFTSNRTWLRTIAVVLFGLAALQSFGILSVTIELLEMISFQFGERKISVLDLMNGLGILLALLWGSSFLGGAGEKRINSTTCPTLATGIISKSFPNRFGCNEFCHRPIDDQLDLSSFAILGVRLVLV